MSATLNPTGPYVEGLAGVHTQFPMPTFVFCSSIITTPSSYQAAGDPSVLDFGATLSQIYIVNLGSNDLVFQWKEQWGATTPDAGYIPGGNKTPVRLDRVFKTGMRVRSADASLSTTCVIWGI